MGKVREKEKKNNGDKNKKGESGCKKYTPFFYWGVRARYLLLSITFVPLPLNVPVEP